MLDSGKQMKIFCLNKAFYRLIAIAVVSLLCGCSGSIGVSKNADRNDYSLLNRPDELMPLTSNVLANYSLYKEYYDGEWIEIHPANANTKYCTNYLVFYYVN